jgi:hypothetical protein
VRHDWVAQSCRPALLRTKKEGLERRRLDRSHKYNTHGSFPTSRRAAKKARRVKNEIKKGIPLRDPPVSDTQNDNKVEKYQKPWKLNYFGINKAPKNNSISQKNVH